MDSELKDLVGAAPSIERLVTGMGAPFQNKGEQFTEGPVFSRRGYLLFCDIPTMRIMKLEQNQLSVFRVNRASATGLTFDHQGRLLVCETGRLTRTEKDGSITVLAESYQGKKLNIPNDLVYAIDGSIYFSDLRHRNAVDDHEHSPFSALYQLTPKGELRLASRDCERPNGVALAPNQQKLYLADSGRRNIWVYEIAPDGSLKNGRVFADMSNGGPGVPDGLKTDEGGNVWVAGPGGIWVFNAGGRRLGTVPTPENPSNFCWGEGFHDLYVTARISVYKIATRVNGTRTF
jgi:gluconolactonase